MIRLPATPIAFTKSSTILILAAVGLAALLEPITASAQERPEEVLNNASVTQMLTGKVPKSLIVTKIQTTKTAFDVTPRGLVGLYTDKVPTDVIKLMMKVAASSESKEILTNDGVILMVTSGLPRDVIMVKIESTKQDFDLTAGGLVHLNQNKVPQEVMKAMMSPPTAPASSGHQEIATPQIQAAPAPAMTPVTSNPIVAPRPGASSITIPKNCKPDIATTDRITKVQVYGWVQNVATTGFLSQAVLEKANVTLNVTIARVGDATVVRLTLTKEEDPEKVARAVIESQYRAEQGNQFILGFKEGGPPLVFVATEASSVTEVKGVLAPKITATVTLTASIKDEDLRALRDSIGARQFDAIRVALSSQSIDKDMKGNGQKLSQKFACYLSFAEQNGYLK